MVQDLVRKVIGTQNDRELKSIRPLVDRINQLEKDIKPLSDDQLKGKTAEFRERLAKGEKLDALLPEAFAVVREAAWRVIGQRHYDVQLIGGITLHRGRIAEMKTGEGKTLVATLPSYLNALTGKGVHIVTVNDYLARRDSEWMGQVHRFLGLSTGVIVHGLTDKERKANYACDITYGTNNEFGFDYLRDNMKFRLEDYVQRDLHFCIVDEVDSILIDEARTPLIISGPTDDSTDLYYEIDKQIRSDGGLTKETDYTIDEKSKTASLTEAGIEKMEKRLDVPNLYDPIHIELLHHVNQALRAHVLFKRDVDYVVKDGEVMIVDEFTGRLMPGRRWSDGLHQAIEAKERVDIENENQTLATITFQNYFRMYDKLSGMTGTADTEAAEFKQIYKLDVTVIPTNRPLIRKDQADVIYKSQLGKFAAAVSQIKELHEKGQPVLVGTVSVEKSELMAKMLEREGIPHSILNAKQHAREADIVAQAGKKGAVTIATNMAGRGTDIILGGNPENLAKNSIGPEPARDASEEEKREYEAQYKEALEKWTERCAAERDEIKSIGGLYILGTERHESRRIDNQLRGRAGRQGDPGATRFYLSFEDDLLRIFGQSELLKRTVAAMEEDQPIEHRWTSKAIENAQKKVEGHNYDIRKHLLKYDDVMNEQRKVIYAWRKEVLKRDNLREMVFSMVEELVDNICEEFFPRGRLRKINGRPYLGEDELNEAIVTTFAIRTNVKESDIQPFNGKGLKTLLMSLAEKAYNRKESEMGGEMVRQIEKMILLTTIDNLWKDHLLAMDHLREGIGLQGYGQKDPLIAYKKQGFGFFEMMMGQITTDCVRKLFSVQLAPQELEAELPHAPQRRNIQYNLSAEGDLIPQEPAALNAGGSPQNFAGAQRTPQPPGRAAAPFDMGQMRRMPKQMQMGRGAMPGLSAGGGQGDGMQAQPMAAPMAQPVMSGVDKVGRNDPCPCGSGKKYKKCHGA